MDVSEVKTLEDAAHACRLSLASFIRVALIEAAAHPERIEEWKAIAERLMAAAPPEQKKPGRPPKKPKK
jgi:hypothetical protein